MNTHEIVDAFIKAMGEYGIKPVFTRGGIEPDGRMVRFHVQGDRKGTRNGFAILFGDNIPAGSFGSWKDGATHSWCAKGYQELTDDERAQIDARMQLAKSEREREERERQGEAARQANLLWRDASPADDSHPYLVRKQVRSHGLRTATWAKTNEDGHQWLTVHGALLVPVMLTSGKIVSLQAIFPDRANEMGRDKDFMSGGRKRGGFFLIGMPPHADGNIVVCEGYATGASIHDATGWCVAVAFDASNMVPVAEDLRAMMPNANFVIAADNDRWSSMGDIQNPGVHFAERAAHAARARLVVPEFADLDDRPSDFNDLHVREGIEVVQRQMFPPMPVVAEEVEELPDFDPRAVDGYTPFPMVDGKGKPLATIENVSELLRRAKITCRYNVISKDLEITVPGAISTVDNASNSAINRVMSLCETISFPTKHLENYMLTVGDMNPYNPVASWITSKPWDGVTRLKDFYDTVTAKTDRPIPSTGGSLKEVLMRKWLISAVAAAFTPNGVVARGVLTFTSKQNLGKTFWVKRLAPTELGVIADGLILNPADKDSVMSCVSNWIVELGEVDATFRKADIAALKGFISKEKDSLRRPYARTESKYPRRTVFFASVNDEQFLHDPTGNTRWWTISVEHLNNKHTIDTQQLWAEVLTLFQAGETWHLTQEELEVLGKHNSDHESINPVHDRVDRAFQWEDPQTTWTHPMRATEICQAAGLDNPTKLDVNAAAAFVTKQYGVEKKKQGKDRSTVWMMPAMARERSGGPF
ncbi:DNA primase [Xanthomonas phage Murka]|nr:DNA primase [Xanthomonas phage Murka]